MGTRTDLRLAVDGDVHALERLFQILGPGLEAFLRHKLRGLPAVPMAVDHLMAEVWMAARQEIPSRCHWMASANRARVFLWFRKVAANRCLGYLSQRVHRDDPLSREVTAEARSVVSEAGESELWGLVRAAIEELPSTDRELLTKRFFDGLTASEIGARDGIPPATVRKRIQRALARLESALPSAVRTGFEDR